MKKYLILMLIISAGISFSLTGKAQAQIIPADRLTDWSYAGIPGGIPNRTTVCANVKNAPYNAKGDGLTDDSEAIKAAIAACPAGQVVYFPEGNYLIKKIIAITKGIVLRGAGPTLSKIIFDHADYPSQYGYNAEMGLAIGSTQSEEFIPVVAGYQKGSMQITLQDASSIKAGNYVVITQENDSNFVNEVGHQGLCAWCGVKRCSINKMKKCGTWNQTCGEGDGECESGKLTLGQTLKVIAVSGNTLSLETPLFWNYLSDFNPRIFKITGVTEYFGIEDLYFTQLGDMTKKIMKFQGCAYCWAKNIESERCDMRHIEGHYFYRNEFRDNYFHDTKCYTGDHGYGFAMYSYSSYNLIQNSIFNKLHLAVGYEGGGGGNVFSYNYFINGGYEQNCGEPYASDGTAIIFHGAHPSYILIEGNKFVNGMGDFIWGSSSHMTAFRNRIYGSGDNPANHWRKALKIEMYERYFNIIGNVIGVENDQSIYEVSGGYADTYNKSYIYELGYRSQYLASSATPAHDPLVKETLLRWGNFDYTNNSTRWEASEIPTGVSVPSNHNLPSSLYLTSKPAWFGNLNFPAIGPDISPMEQKIPAQVRYEQMINPSTCALGDLDCQKGVTITDIQIAVNVFLGIETDETKRTRANVDTSNPDITIADIQKVVNIFLNIN